MSRSDPVENPWAGEVSLRVDGRDLRLKLTLGALAELEQALEAGSLVELVERFENGRFATTDVLALLRAGLRGGGHDLPADFLEQADIEGGPVLAARKAAELLVRAFSLPGEA